MATSAWFAPRTTTSAGSREQGDVAEGRPHAPRHAHLRMRATTQLCGTLEAWQEASGDSESLEQAPVAGQSPADFVDWWGRKYDLNRKAEW